MFNILQSLPLVVKRQNLDIVKSCHRNILKHIQKLPKDTRQAVGSLLSICQHFTVNLSNSGYQIFPGGILEIKTYSKQ